MYELPRRSGQAHLYRLNHPLAQIVLARAKDRHLPAAEVHFDYSEYIGKVSALEQFVGKSGSLSLSRFTVESLDQAEDHLIFAAVADDGRTLDDEAAARLIGLPGRVVADRPADSASPPELADLTQQRQAAIQRDIFERNARFFEAEADKLDGWADDLKLGLEREIKELDRQIKEARRAATAALTLEEKLAGQKQIKALESQRSVKRRSLFDAQDEVDRQREQLIQNIEAKLAQKTSTEVVFSLRWRLT